MNDDIMDRILLALKDNPLDEELSSEAARSQSPLLAATLHSLMTDISARRFHAQWHHGLEEILWEVVMGNAPPALYPISGPTADALEYLHQRCGGWWVWHDDRTGAGPNPLDWGPRFKSHEEWLEMCDQRKGTVR